MEEAAASVFDRSVRRADARFILPIHPTSALVMGPDDGWERALGFAGVAVGADAPSVPDLVVAPGRRSAEAAASGAAMVLLEGPASVRPLRAAGYAVERYLVLPEARRPTLVVPLRHGPALRWALRARSVAAPAWRRTGAQVGAAAVRTLPRVVRPSSVLVVASRRGVVPFPLAEAARVAPVEISSWYLRLGTYDDLAERRMAFLVAAKGDRAPRWAVKVARLAGMDDAFDRDEQGIGMLDRAGPEVAARAPRLLGRSSIAGLPVSVETAAPGHRLTEVLRRGGHDELPLVRAICRWLVDLGVATQAGPASLLDERRRFEVEVAPSWEGQVDVGALLSRLGDVPGVLVHSDLGTWNLTAERGDFAVLDWESAHHGLPLWDLLYLLSDACAQIERRAGPGQRADYLASLFRGEAALSPFLFERVREAATSLALPPDGVGVIATLGWLHRAAALLDPSAPSDPEPDMVRFARIWLTDPELGSMWSRWR